MNKIIINCDENLNKTIALISEGKLVELYRELAETTRLEGNIYFGIVEDIIPGMQAAFVNIGQDKKAFLHIKDVLPKANNYTGNKNEDYSNYNLKDYIRVGMPIIVQVKKDKTGKKGARVSTHLNIAGRYTVLMPNLNFITVSQKIDDNVEIEHLKNIIKSIDIENHGIIIRTSAEGKSEKAIIEDVQNSINLYKNIEEMFKKSTETNEFKPQVVYEVGGIVNKLLIDIIDKDIESIITNNEDQYKDIKQLLNNMNCPMDILKLDKDENILEKYGLENSIEQINNRRVWLKCGGFIAIDKTEALTAIDVNTGKFTGNNNPRETILKVNKEATIEIAKQLRLRDIGGIIIIDYIDMESKEDEKEIVELLEKCLKEDRAKTQVIDFSPLHLLEMTRKHVFSRE